MSKLSKDAFAIMAMCEKTKEPFGITVDPRNGCYAFAWAFKIKKEQAKREGYDKTHVRGVVMYDDNFNGCPHCGAKISTFATDVAKWYAITGKKW